MTKGIPLTPREAEEYDRVFRVMDNLDKGLEPEKDDFVPAEAHYAEQMSLFWEVGP